MADFLSWVQSNWFDAAQTLGIMATLYLDARAREDENWRAMCADHQHLSELAAQNPELQRVFQADADVASKPLTFAEERFLNSKIVHFIKGWRLAGFGRMISRDELAIDVRGFFTRPLPRAVWEKTKQTRPPKFVEFVERALEADGRLRPTGA